LGSATYLVATAPSPAKSIGTISLFAFAGYRLIPAIQQIFSGISTLRFVRPSVFDLDRQKAGMAPANKYLIQASTKEIMLKSEIALKDITFSYPQAFNPTLRRLSLLIPAFSTVGIIGSTGSGKTTVIDILLGLLEPNEGRLEVDGISITGGLAAAWRRCIGYVPQHIYLADDTLAANIAFGIPPWQVNRGALEAAARKANLHEFISTSLAQGYETFVGERGIRLSGGQRQRIGIARALYPRPKVLVFDEATSALDNISETAVMEAVRNLRKDMTIIIIAHRLTTLKDCDQIYVIEKGELVDHGSYQDVSARSLLFQTTMDCSTKCA
jgi:ABC-type multidrug transport system fused ATPase/permease subunit